MGQKAIEGVEGLNRAGEISELGRFSRSRQLMWGHSLYLIWWCIFFRPNAQVKGGALRIFGIACILVAAVEVPHLKVSAKPGVVPHWK